MSRMYRLLGENTKPDSHSNPAHQKGWIIKPTWTLKMSPPFCFAICCCWPWAAARLRLLPFDRQILAVYDVFTERLLFKERPDPPQLFYSFLPAFTRRTKTSTSFLDIYQNTVMSIEGLFSFKHRGTKQPSHACNPRKLSGMASNSHLSPKITSDASSLQHAHLMIIQRWNIC